MTAWRVGRSLGRTVYIMVGEEPSKDDHFVGVMDSRELAEAVVAAMNAQYDRQRALADLRAKIQALYLMSDADLVYEDGYEAAKRDVLDLIEGGDHGNA